MTAQSRAKFRSCEARPGHTACLLPEMAGRLVGGVFLPGYFEAGELREMSKFREIANVWGLAAYGVECGIGGGPACHRQAGRNSECEMEEGENAKCKTGNSKCKMEELEVEAMEERFAGESWVMAEGVVGEGGKLMSARVIVPQGWAHLAAGMRLMLREWARGDEVAMADLTVVVWPTQEFGEGVWRGEGEAVVLGCDDIGVLAEVIEEAGKEKMGGELGQGFWGRGLELAEELGKTEEGRARALGVGSWLFGVEVDADGHFPGLEGMRESGAGWVIAGDG